MPTTVFLQDIWGSIRDQEICWPRSLCSHSRAGNVELACGVRGLTHCQFVKLRVTPMRSDHLIEVVEKVL